MKKPLRWSMSVAMIGAVLLTACAPTARSVLQQGAPVTTGVTGSTREKGEMMPPDPTSREDVRDVLERNKEKIMKDYHAAGVGIGKIRPSDQTYVITVFLESAEDVPNSPVLVEGIPLKFEVTGKFKTL